MIQRVQSIFLVMVLVMGILLFVTAHDVDIAGSYLPVQSAVIAVLLLALISIFSFKKRKTQLLLNNMSIVLNAVLLVLLMYWLFNLPGGISFPEKGIEPIFPVVAIMALALANVYIMRDERLVKSADRLR